MHSDKNDARSINLAVCALGGQGGGVLSDWIIHAADHAGLIVQATSVPGVAQRTGATIYYLEIFSQDLSKENNKTPILSLMPMPGDVDVVLASEWMEAGRAISRGLVTDDRTTLIASTHRILAISEKSTITDGVASSDVVAQNAERAAKHLIAFDMEEMAKENGSVISSVLLGALAGSGVTPIPKEAFEHVIKKSGIAVDRSLAAFKAGFEATLNHQKDLPFNETIKNPSTEAHVQTVPKKIKPLLTRLETEFEEQLHEILLHGLRRVVDYQDPAYGQTYLDEMQKILKLDQSIGGTGRRNRLSKEVARYLALWMSYEDTIRVAELKCRDTRFDRVAKEVKAKEGEIIEVTEYMHPRVEEVCDTLPFRLGRYILKNKKLKSALNKLINKPRKVRTTKLTGFLLLYCLSRLKSYRRSTYRFSVEKAKLELWLKDIIFIAPQNYDLACEMASCQRLVKGYGATFERGVEQFDTILNFAKDHLSEKNISEIIKTLREAALEDEEGKALEKALERVVFL